MKNITIFTTLIFFLSISIYANDLFVVEKMLNSLDNKVTSSSSPKEQLPVEKYLKIANLMYTTSDHIMKSIDTSIPLNGNQLDSIHRLVTTYIGLNYHIFESTFNYIPKTIFKDKKNELADLSWLTSHIIAIQSFKHVIQPYFENSKLRRILDAADSTFKINKHQLRKLIKKVISVRLTKVIRKALIKFNQHEDNFSDNDLVTFLSSKHTQELILNKKLYRDFRKKYSGQTMTDLLSNTVTLTTNQLSGLFGNSIGLVHWRKGYLLNKVEIHEEILSKLKPLDIITEKTGFALTDKFIPGHFGHNAIWLGTRDQLIKIGMWNHPSIIPHQKKISEGFSIIEVLRNGSHLTTLKRFMNIDEFAIMRIKNVLENKAQVYNTYRIAMGQLGKTYDFNFDVQTTDKLVCSELLYQAFDFIKWPTEKIAGRFTISPDNVASNAIHKNSPIQLKYYVSSNKYGVLFKNKFDLGKNLGFTYNRNKDVFEKVKIKCRYKDLPENHPLNKCKRKVQELNYTAVQLLSKPKIQVAYNLSKKKIKFSKWMTKPGYIY